jgi:hypothetical protein
LFGRSPDQPSTGGLHLDQADWLRAEAAGPPMSTSQQFCSKDTNSFLARGVIGGVQLEQAKEFCGQFHSPTVLRPDSKPIAQANGLDGVYYAEAVSWINDQADRCKDATLSQTVLGSEDCTNLLYNSWKNCMFSLHSLSIHNWTLWLISLFWIR